eukprot:TRINITY_DN2496_c0_g1_i1.p1 TRINITY_DN2496_c0_g1~~TRINITY_DN2496_c0_g1_i1.p1  ORF type:complete len:61 (-),score=10.98 TRINITY_DN2496_c0_g1_i1:105-287(-)
MPLEQAEGEGYKKLPNLELAQALFTLLAPHSSNEEKDLAKTLLDKEITENNMAPFYQRVL